MRLRRLLIVSEPGKDGVFDYVAGQVDHLHRLHPGISVDLAYSSRRSGAGLPRLVERVRERGGEAVDLEIGNAPEPGDLRAAARLVGLVRRRRPGAVHAESSKAGALCRLLRLAWPGFPPVVYTPHAYFGLDGGRSPKSRIYNGIEAALGRVGFSVSASSDERRFALDSLGLPPDRIVLVNIGTDVRRFRPPPPGAREAGREKFGLPAGARVLVSVGRDSHQKNYPPLYRALAPLLSDPALNLFFVHAGAGGAELGRALPPAARERFRALDYVNPVEELLWAADAFVLTSLYEGLSLSVLGALACGLRMFLTRVPGNRCLASLGFGGIGWIDPAGGEAAPPERTEALLRAWLARPADEEGDRARSEAQAAKARYCFDSEIQYGKVLRLLDRLSRP